MSAGCRDCRTCTNSGIVKFARFWLLLIVYLGTVFLFPLFSKLFRRHCPDCTHPLSRHEYRRDGSFRD
jgi:hypothetical protein